MMNQRKIFLETYNSGNAITSTKFILTRVRADIYVPLQDYNPLLGKRRWIDSLFYPKLVSLLKKNRKKN